jgi:flagella basal body P-ring formation protein FlgA
VLLTNVAATECVAVPGSEVLAKDLAPRFQELANVPASQVMMLAPNAGVIRWITPLEGQRIWLKAGLTQGPASAFCIRRESLFLTTTQILEAMDKAFSGENVHVDILEFSRFPIPKGRLDFPVSGLAGSPRTRPEEAVLWRGRVLVDVGGSQPVWVKAKLRVSRKQAVAKREIAAGHVLSPDDVEIVTREVFPLQKRADDRLRFFGQIAKFRIRAGQQLVSTLFEPAFEVAAGQTVRVDVVHEQVHLRFSAIAEHKGRTGELIWVKASSGKRVRARVSGPEEVIVEVGRNELDSNGTRRIRTGSNSRPRRVAEAHNTSAVSP